MAEREALLMVTKSWRRFDWDRFLLAWCAAFHLIVACILGLFPYERLLTEGTRPVLQMLPPIAWAGLFFGGALSAGLLLIHESRLLQAMTLFGVLLLGGTWLTAFTLAVLRGAGSPVSLAVWPFLYGPWLIVAARTASGKR